MSRVTGPRLLKQQLSYSSARRLSSSPTVRNPSSVISPEARHAAYAVRSHAELQSECRRCRITAIGSKTQLIESLAIHDHIQTRHLMTAHTSTPLRPTVKSSTSSVTPTTNLQQTSSFNTSRALKAVKDSSPIDFAFLPSMPDVTSSQDYLFVPFAPDNFSPARAAVTDEAPVMRAEISVISHGASETVAPSAMTEVADNSAIDLDPFSLVDKVTFAAAGMGHLAGGKRGVVGEVIGEMWEDLISNSKGGLKFT